MKFVVDQLNLTILLDKFDSLSYGVDEMLFPSLNSEDSLGKFHLIKKFFSNFI